MSDEPSQSTTVASALRAVAAQARPAPLPKDLWSKGQRRHRRRVALAIAAMAVLALVVAAPLAFVSQLRPMPADERPSVPSRLYSPLPLQKTVQTAPTGPASLIVTGPGGFGANDIFGYDDRALVIGRNGAYRWLRAINAFDAGESLLLSPDGRYVAGAWELEGAQPDDDFTNGAAVVDLTTGSVRTYHAGTFLAWTPDGRGLLTRRNGALALLDRDSGMIREVGAAGTAVLAAFAPDGRRVAIQVGPQVRVIELATGATRTLMERGTLAGPGAWRSDGRIAVWNQPACALNCEYSVELSFQVDYVDAELGAYVDGPRLDSFDATSARLLGWQNNGDAVVAVYDDVQSGRHGPSARVMAFGASGGSTELVQLPSDANRVDVARDLLDRFGGAPASVPARLLDWTDSHLRELAILAALIVAVVGTRLVRRRIRTGFWRVYPGGNRRRVHFPRRL